MNGSTPRLLVVDDNEDNRYTLALMLRIEGYECITFADDGVQALEKLRSDTFDLLLLDVMMPRLDGYEVLRRLKDEGRLRDLPVLMVSAVTELDSVVRCIELGADDYLPKPFNRVLLKARIAACLEKKRLRDAALAHAARMERELADARELQLSMIPTAFPLPGADWPVEMYAIMEPAHEVGGDLFDFFRLDDGRMLFFVGDVSDKGVPAALFMARAKNLVRLIAELARADDGAILPPAEIMTRVNRELCADNATLMFVTLFLGIVDGASRRIDFCNAGHNNPYHISPRSGIRPLSSAKGWPLGIRPVAAYETAGIVLDQGDSVFVFSDGVTEANDAALACFSEARLESVLCNLIAADAWSIVNGVLAAVSQFMAGAPPADDMTMLAIRLLRQDTSAL